MLVNGGIRLKWRCFLSSTDREHSFSRNESENDDMDEKVKKGFHLQGVAKMNKLSVFPFVEIDARVWLIPENRRSYAKSAKYSF